MQKYKKAATRGSLFVFAGLLAGLLAAPVSAATLVGFWNLNENGGVTATDDSGSGNTGTLINSPAWIPGESGSALNFVAGGKGYVAASGGESLADLYKQGLTVAAWIKPRSGGGGNVGRIVDKDNNNGGWFFAMNGTTGVKLTIDTFTTSSPSRASTAGIKLNVWQHVAATWDGSTNGSNIHVYINGVLADGTVVNGAGTPEADEDTPFAIGNRSVDTARPFDGGIDEVHVYSGVLTAAEIQALASGSTPPPDTQPPTVPTGLKATAVTTSSIAIGWTASTDLPSPGGTGVAGYYVYRGGNTTTPIATIKGSTSYTDTGLTSGTTYTYQVAAFDAATPANVSAPSAVLSVATASQTSISLTGGDIGAVAAKGSSTVSGSTYTIKGSGVDIYGTADSFQFDSQALTGDGTITARVVSETNTNVWAKAGVMFRETLAAGSSFSAIVIAANNPAALEARIGTGAATLTTKTATFKAAPYWVRMSRAGNVFTGSISPDGVTWTVVGTYTVPMAAALHVGLAVTSHNNGALNTAVFDHVTITSASTPVQVVVAPATITLTTGTLQQFSATVSNASNTNVTWQVNGVNGGVAATGTISATGVYTAPASLTTSPATFTIRAVSAQDASATGTAQATVVTRSTSTVDVTTYKYDLARTGLNFHETALTTANVRSATFGLQRSLPGDGAIFAQPLFLSNLTVAGNVHNVVFFATEHNSLYAYDSDTGAKLWQVSLNSAGETTSDNRSCGVVSPEIGVTATPVIDRNAGPHGALYVVTATKDSSGGYHHRIHAIDVTTGAELFSGPKEITATYPTSSGGTNTFDPGTYLERAGLLLLNGEIYTTWASHCDNFPYGGWIIAFNGTTLARTRVLSTGPNGNDGGPAIWQSGGAPAADGNGFIYLLTGNGVFETTLDANGFPSKRDYGNSFLKLSTAGNTLTVADYFSMWNEVAESTADLDFGSGGAMLLPDLTDSSGVTRQLGFGAGKDGNIYIVRRDAMGKFNASTNNIWQQVDQGGQEVRSTPAYFNGHIYLSAKNVPMQAYTLTAAKLSASPTSQTSNAFGYPGAVPVVSSNGSNNGIVWAFTTANPSVLYAYDANNLATQFYNSTQAAGGRDNFGVGNKFNTAIVVGGKVFVPTTTGVAEFGLLP
ncbi:MAG: PQQ-binding-like beta-propeller repeat protein [Proteobacteria bacterium]|nr:PQQ-binding-like beta-propeller repeat protein [Pseudomonadota bacterium]